MKILESWTEKVTDRDQVDQKYFNKNLKTKLIEKKLIILI